MIQEQGALIPIQEIDCRSCVLIARLPSFAVAAIDLARVIQIVWLLFNQTTVIVDKNGILAVFEFHGQNNTKLD